VTDTVQVEIKAPLATITLNKPERLNGLDFEMWEGIADACCRVEATPEVRVAILTGAGGCFCAGLDGTYWRERESWLDWEAQHAIAPLLSQDRREGIRAAAEHRSADFTGR